MKGIFVTLCVIFFSSVASAQNTKPPICIEAETPDSIGSMLHYRLAPEIRKASSFAIADECSSALIKINFVSQDIDKNNSYLAGKRTVFSYAISIRLTTAESFAYFTSFVSYCGRDMVDACASTLGYITERKLIVFKIALEQRLNKN